MATGRILGLDFGERRIGVAISDPDARFALPLHSIDTRAGDAIGQIEALTRAEDVTAVVVGLPLSLSGDHTAQTETTIAFARDLEARLKLPVHLHDERLSTQEAMHLVSDQPGRGRKAKARDADTDALAASIILQAYLDAQRFAAEPAP
ncbi:MAG TPA: Holliday junction resolvase RuvX [Dehalococcoidia bacterium]|nr:Holliday junction resolvase RuvX [Dehalococcoidia bacterium]